MDETGQRKKGTEPPGVQRPYLGRVGKLDNGVVTVLLLHLGSWQALPAENAVSRYFERLADRTALDLAGRPEAFVDAEKRLARTNLGNVAPAPWNVWLFATHPPTVERIRMAEEWEASRNDKNRRL